MHALLRKSMHARTHTHTQAHTHTRARKLARKPMRKYTPAKIHTRLALQVAFLTSVFGGSTKYSDDPHIMFRAHAKLIKEKGLQLHHFHKVQPSKRQCLHHNSCL